MSFQMPPMPFPIPPLFITAVKDICAINTFEKLLNILFSEVYCWHFGFRRLLFSATITDMSLYEVLNLFTRWPLVFRSFLHPPHSSPVCALFGQRFLSFLIKILLGINIYLTCLNVKLNSEMVSNFNVLFFFSWCRTFSKIKAIPLHVIPRLQTVYCINEWGS